MPHTLAILLQLWYLEQLRCAEPSSTRPPPCSGAWRKGRASNLVTSRTRVSPDPHETAEADLARTRQTVSDSPASCVLGSVPAGISVPPQGGGTPSAGSRKATPLGRQKHLSVTHKTAELRLIYRRIVAVRVKTCHRTTRLPVKARIFELSSGVSTATGNR